MNMTVITLHVRFLLNNYDTILFVGQEMKHQTGTEDFDPKSRDILNSQQYSETTISPAQVWATHEIFWEKRLQFYQTYMKCNQINSSQNHYHAVRQIKLNTQQAKDTKKCNKKKKRKNQAQVVQVYQSTNFITKTKNLNQH